MKRVKLRISGIVQGVFYRKSAKIEADRLGVFGYVRNLPNGDVEAEVYGDDEAVNRFIEWAKVGPKRAKVDVVEVTNLDPNEGEKFGSFEIRY
ncbi:MAG: acylphosphatase [Methanobacteriota archaeon]|nr:MAG: acylphosphatase [Euryarchaeota archaeon]